MDLRFSVSGGLVSSGVCDGRDDFGFGVVGFHFWMVVLPVLPLAGFEFLGLFGLLGCLVVWLVSVPVVGVWLLGFSGACCRCRRLRKTFSKFCRRRCGLVSGFNFGLETLLHRGLSGPEFCGGLVCELKKTVGGAGFSDRFVAGEWGGYRTL